jgi:hypothetical protein
MDVGNVGGATQDDLVDWAKLGISQNLAPPRNTKRQRDNIEIWRVSFFGYGFGRLVYIMIMLFLCFQTEFDFESVSSSFVVSDIAQYATSTELSSLQFALC